MLEIYGMGCVRCRLSGMRFGFYMCLDLHFTVESAGIIVVASGERLKMQ